jgi:hypothetical protein
MEHPDEMNFTRLELAHYIGLVFKPRYEAVFGKFPDLSDSKRFPPKGSPGQPASTP